MLGQMGGWKTWTGAFFVALGAVLTFLGYEELSKAIMGLGAAIGVVGLGHKIEKNRTMKSIGILLLLPLLMGCAGQSATQQMMSQTDDVVLIGKAALFDVEGIYKDTAETYLRYELILKEEYPDKNQKVKELLNEMKGFIDDWRLLEGMTQILAINDGSEEFQDIRRQVIFQLADFID